MTHHHRHYDYLLSDDRRKFENPDNFLPQLLKGGEVIVDLGSGPGYYCKYLQKFASKLYCIDIDEEALKIAKDLVPSCITMKDLSGIQDNSVDVVVLANSFHDMDNKEKIVNEIRRVLKDKGRVIVVDWRKDSPIGPPFWIRMDKEDYLKYFNTFTLERDFDVGPYHFGIVLIKN